MKIIFYFLLFITCIWEYSCTKDLDTKPNQELVIPVSLADFQAILYNPSITDGSAPGVLDFGSDDYYLSFSDYQALLPKPRNSHIWATDIWEGAPANDWNDPYSVIYKANVVLEGLNGFELKTPSDLPNMNVIKGHALFLRGVMHYFLEETFGQPYKPSSKATDQGIPLRLTSNLNLIPIRSSVEVVYNQIVADLEQSIKFLPEQTVSRNSPSKAAAYAMLARVYLSMQNYQKALVNADFSIKISGVLQDYNSMALGVKAAASTNKNPFSAFAPPNDFGEVLYPCYQLIYGSGLQRQATTLIDSNLYKSYDNNDWRKTIYFIQTGIPNKAYFKGFYSGSGLRPNIGPAIDEMYLTRSECFARIGNMDSALIDLNTLLINRFKSGAFTNIQAADTDEALHKILEERRKELIFRGIRWSDLRRLNQDPRFAVIITRNLNGQKYTLLPNDKKYTYPIPDEEIQLSGISQNPR